MKKCPWHWPRGTGPWLMALGHCTGELPQGTATGNAPSDSAPRDTAPEQYPAPVGQNRGSFLASALWSRKPSLPAGLPRGSRAAYCKNIKNVYGILYQLRIMNCYRRK